MKSNRRLFKLLLLMPMMAYVCTHFYLLSSFSRSEIPRTEKSGLQILLEKKPQELGAKKAVTRITATTTQTYRAESNKTLQVRNQEAFKHIIHPSKRIPIHGTLNVTKEPAKQTQPQTALENNWKHTSTGGRWAYAFLIGGCNLEKPEYRGFLFNVLVAAERLRNLGSRADVVALLQMSVSSNLTKLPNHEETMLTDLGVKFKYLPKFSSSVHEVFYSLVMEKFRILELTEYNRVLFVDGDIMPLCSLDYLFELSDPEYGEPVLKENVILSWKREASNAGFFLLKPDTDDYTRIQHVIRTKEEKALSLPYPHWDEEEGWGHRIEPPDFWRSPKGNTGTNWTWHAVFADQGLLYHWTKYEKQSVSIIINGEIENWGSKNDTAVMENMLEKDMLRSNTCIETPWLVGASSPYQDFKHFPGRSKPWEKNRTGLFHSVSNDTVYDFQLLRDFELQEMWYQSLRRISEKYHITFDFDFAKGENRTPPVGRFSDPQQMIEHIMAKKKTNWSPYEE